MICGLCELFILKVFYLYELACYIVKCELMVFVIFINFVVL
jgi:hypothetical protein